MNKIVRKGTEKKHGGRWKKSGQHGWTANVKFNEKCRVFKTTEPNILGVLLNQFRLSADKWKRLWCFLQSRKKKFGLVLIMQQCPPNSGGQAISEAYLLKEKRGRIMAVSLLGSSFKYGKSIGRLGGCFGNFKLVTRSGKIQLKSWRIC